MVQKNLIIFLDYERDAYSANPINLYHMSIFNRPHMNFSSGENPNYLASVLTINVSKRNGSKNSHLYMNCKQSIDSKARII